MKVSATVLRNDVYRLLDLVLESGQPLEIERKGRTLRIISEEERPKLGRLVHRNTIAGDAEDLVHGDWADQWKPSI